MNDVNWKTENFFTLDCKTVFNNFCPFICFVYGTLLIQNLNACKSIIIFFILNCPIKLSVSWLLDVNQLTIAEMDTFSLLQFIERILELRIEYMGSYPSDKVPQLTKYSFAIINSAPSNDRGEHWFIIARIDKTYSKLIHWVESDQFTPFCQKISKNGSSKATNNW